MPIQKIGRERDQNEKAAYSLNPVSAFPTEIGPDADADDRRDDHRDTHQHDRVPEHGLQDLDHRSPVVEGRPEIPCEQIADVVEVLLVQRRVEAPGVAQSLQGVRREFTAPEKDSGRIARDQAEHAPHQGHDRKQRDRGLDEAPPNITPKIHLAFVSLCSRARRARVDF